MDAYPLAFFSPVYEEKPLVFQRPRQRGKEFVVGAAGPTVAAVSSVVLHATHAEGLIAGILGALLLGHFLRTPTSRITCTRDGIRVGRSEEITRASEVTKIAVRRALDGGPGRLVLDVHLRTGQPVEMRPRHAGAFNQKNAAAAEADAEALRERLGLREPILRHYD